MDVLTFTSKIIASLIWPLVVVFVVIAILRPLRELIADLGRRISNIKFPGGEAEFSDKLARIKDAANNANLPPVQPTIPVEPEPLKVDGDERVWAKLIEISPRAAIVEAWRQLEGEMREVARNNDVPEKELNSPLDLIRALERSSIFSSDIFGIISNLRGIRNTAAHRGEVEILRSDATDYVLLAKRVIAKLRTK